MNKEKAAKEYAQRALRHEYGFCPPKNQIALYEIQFDGDAPQYVLFGIGGFKYSYDGFTLERR